MKRIYLVLIILIGISVSCTKNFQDYRIDQKHPTDVPGQFLFANAQKNLADQVVIPNVNYNNWKLWAQYWTETTYTDEANYDVVTRDIGSTIFRTYYRDILADLNEARKVIEAEAADGDVAAGEKANKLLIVTLVECYAYNRLVDIFGDVPYTEAVDANNKFPKYDDAFTIYKDLLTRTKDAVTNLNTNYGSFGSDDLYMGGDVAMWKKFGNTLLVKMALTISSVDAGLAQSYIEGAYAGAFAEGEVCELVYPGATNSNPINEELVKTGRHDYVAANTIVDIMNNLTDPRRPKFFEINGEEYTGGIYGESSAYTQYSHVADAIQEETFPAVLLDYTELCFYLAECAERGFSVGQSAEAWYNAGVMSSMNDWGVSSDDADAYMAQADVAYATAPGDWHQKIGTQAWLAFYIRGLLGWTSYRRLGYPTFNLPPNIPPEADGAVPRRHSYAINEQTLNPDSYYAAVDAMGGDRLSTKIFWDK
jgi:uncharacterized protein YozE (UPF0346 family)